MTTCMPNSTAERRELLAKATPGSWVQHACDVVDLNGSLIAAADGPTLNYVEANAALIVAAVNDYARHLDIEDTLAELLRLIRVPEDGSDQSYLTAVMERARHLLTGASDHGK